MQTIHSPVTAAVTTVQTYPEDLVEQALVAGVRRGVEQQCHGQVRDPLQQAEHD